MPLDPDDVAEAHRLQALAAHERSIATRLVAGPGTGKSSSIEERFRWLIADEGIPADSLFGVSFTRAAANDLRLRVGGYLDAKGVSILRDDLRISTLHSLALRLLARANLLGTFPVKPRVFDEWEVEHIFDGEFRAVTGMGKRRAEDVRRAHEAFWNTGEPMPAGYLAPDPPITDEERTAFRGYHRQATQTYAAVLPGEIVRRCVQQVEAGLLDPGEVVGIEHLIVDEYQDLNPLDIRFIDQLSEAGVEIFVAGDDDQSIYSFRFASPNGIQDFAARHDAVGDHILEACFRCATAIVAAADGLIENFSPVKRIPKELRSLWDSANPPIAGRVLRWRIVTGDAEAEIVARSMRRLIDEGMPPDKIMVLLSNKRLFPPIRTRLERLNVPFLPPKEDTWSDTDAGRFVLGVVRVSLDEGDYIALRIVLGCRRGVGIATCASIADTAATRLLNYRSLFYDALPEGLFRGREAAALDAARSVCASVAGFGPDDTVAARGAALRLILAEARGEEEAEGWDELVGVMPPESTLTELRDYLSADTTHQQETVLGAIYARLGQEHRGSLPVPRVRVMSMHGAKGLQADVVFIPGLEEPILPGPRRRGSPGLVLEGARLLYVSATRARAALVLSLARRRSWQGSWTAHPPSQYAAFLGGAFVSRQDGLSEAEARAIVDDASAMTVT